MRYGTIRGTFWTGETGRALRGCMEAQVIGTYLMTCQHSNMLGLYYIPMMFASHETGIPLEGASKGLKRCIEAGFCSYDFDAEVVWIHNMMKYQTADELKPADKRVSGIQKELNGIPKTFLIQEFVSFYRHTHHVVTPANYEAPCKGLKSPLDAPSMPDTDTDTKTDTDTESNSQKIEFKSNSQRFKERFAKCATEDEKRAEVDRLMQELAEEKRAKY